MTSKTTTPKAAIVALLGAILATSLHGQPKLPAPIGARPGVTVPMNEQPQGGKRVTFNSPQADATDLPIDAMLYKPDTTARGAVVVVNAAPGWSDFREGQYARALSSAGYAVLTIDTYGPRGIDGTQADNASLSTLVQARDALAARRYLVSIGYPVDRMAVMGTGRGGTIALLVADRTFVQNERERFVAAMAISASCIFRPKTPKPASRVFIAIGDKDDVAGVQPCKDFASEFANAGGRVDVKVYPGASSGFDGHPGVLGVIRDPFMETFVNCSVAVEPDGRSSYNGKTFAESDTAALIGEMRKSCIKRGGSGWTNLTQKAAVTFDLIEFLDANFRH
ncbi:dienelactone hydrolase family protein [Variovorax sp. dw_954]|uniref:dienelactone hydrolase family protein n=1 Tax=Variovorax sp. dw_954 TaxID=2720078 RepID=UPI001BD21FCB|nr:dienelactone hydrolase family protein [Variovorax sp. dw_954]